MFKHMYCLSTIIINESNYLSHLVIHILRELSIDFLLFCDDDDELLENNLLNIPCEELLFSKKILLNLVDSIADIPASYKVIFGKAELKFLIVGLINLTRFPTREATARHCDRRSITTN